MAEIIRRDFTAPVQLLATDARTVAGVISTGALDRWGETIDPAGVRWGPGVKLLWSHDPRSPIGKAERISVDGDKVDSEISASPRPAWIPPPTAPMRCSRMGSSTASPSAASPTSGAATRCIDFEVVEVSSSLSPPTLTRSSPMSDQPRRAPWSPPIAPASSASPAIHASGAPAIRRSDPAVQTWNFGRFLALVAPQFAPPDVDPGFEREVSDELNRYATRGGFKIPLGHLLTRAGIGTKPGDLRREPDLGRFSRRSCSASMSRRSGRRRSWAGPAPGCS